jgi:DNA-binding FadR family transcriptional regulator
VQVRQQDRSAFVSRKQLAGSSREAIAGDIALAAHQGAISPGSPFPTARELADGYDVPLRTARAALRRLERLQIASTGHDGTLAAGDAPPQALLLAAVSACRILTQPPADPTAADAWRTYVSAAVAELRQLGEALAQEARLALRTPPGDGTLETARKLLATAGPLLEGTVFPWQAGPGVAPEP